LSLVRIFEIVRTERYERGEGGEPSGVRAREGEASQLGTRAGKQSPAAAAAAVRAFCISSPQEDLVL